MAGLTTALALQETGCYSVSVLAETFPSDPKRADYTSPWAVCHLFALHLAYVMRKSFQGAHQALHVGGDERARRKSVPASSLKRVEFLKAVSQELEEDTFKVMWELSGENNSASHHVRRVTEHEYFVNDLDIRTHWMPDVSGTCR